MTHAPKSKQAAAPARAKQAAPANLKIGAPDDAFEHEADRMAEEIMAADPFRPRWSFASMSVAPRVQRECACGGQCDDCKEKKKLQRKATDGASPMAETAPASVQQALSVPGQPLDPPLRLEMDRHFGYDFAGVRIHCDSASGRSARDVGANAYTVGEDIVFADGRFAPETPAGRRLLAHELTHVVQQSSGRLQRAVQRQSCTHDGQATMCRADRGVWRNLEDPDTGEKFNIAIAERILEGPNGLRMIGGAGEWVREAQTPPNPRKKGKARGHVDIGKVKVGKSLEFEVVEVKGRSNAGGGCSKATYEAEGYVTALRPLEPRIVSLSAKLAPGGGFKIDEGCVPKKAADARTLQAAGVNLSDPDARNAWCFYNSLQQKLGRVFTTPFSGVDVRPFKVPDHAGAGGGAKNKPYTVPPPVVVYVCPKTKANPTGKGYRYLQYMVNQEGGVSYGCYDKCGISNDEEKRRQDEQRKEAQKDLTKQDPAQKFTELRDPAEIRDPGSPARHQDPNAPTPVQDTGEEDPLQLQPGGVSEELAILEGGALLTTVAYLHMAAKANPGQRALVQSLITEKIEEAAGKGALDAAEKLDGANITKYGVEAGDAVVKETGVLLEQTAAKSPGFLARFGPGALKTIGRGAAILGIVLTAKDALAGINHIRKGGTIKIGLSGDDVELSGETHVKDTGVKGSKPAGEVKLTDTIIDIETKHPPDTSGKLDIEADKVTIRGPVPTNDAPVTINMKMKLSNATITFKSNGVYRDGRAVIGDLTIADSEIEIDLPPGIVAPDRKADESRTISGVKLKITSIGTGGGGGGAPGAPNVKPAHETPPGSESKTDQPKKQETTGPDRAALVKQIMDDPNLRKLYSELAGKGIVPTDEMLRRLVALAPMLKQHPKAIETVVQHLKKGEVTDQIKQIIEPIERNIQQEEAKSKEDKPADPGTKEPGDAPAGQQTTDKPGTATGASPAGRQTTPPAKATAVRFADIMGQLTSERSHSEEDEPPQNFDHVVDWTRGRNTSQERSYRITLKLKLKTKLTPTQNQIWSAEYSYSAPSGTFTSDKGDLPIQFSDAGSGDYSTHLERRKKPPKKAGVRRK